MGQPDPARTVNPVEEADCGPLAPSPHFLSKPKPRPPRSPAEVARIRVRNRRREYLERHPDYLESEEHELADPLLYDDLIRHFHTPAEREAEGRRKGYSRTLESSLLRGEARLAKLASTHDSSSSSAAAAAVGSSDGNSCRRRATQTAQDPQERPGGGPGGDGDGDGDGDAATTTTKSREEGRARWEAFLRERFVGGGDEDFDYRRVDEDDALDELERKDLEEVWFDDEPPGWVVEEGGACPARPEAILRGETGVQDF